MQTKQNLDLRQTQSLVMTPQLQQAIKLLQLSNIELADQLDKEIAQNPLLEKVPPQHSDKDSNEGAKNDENANDESVDSMERDFSSLWTGDASLPSQPDSSLTMGYIGAGGRSSFDDSESFFDARLSQARSLRETLIDQLHLHTDDLRDRMIGSRLIDMLDEQGYLRYDSAELVAELKCSPDRLSRLLSHLKTYDPPGIFARDLKECFKLQLEELGKLSPPMIILLENMNLIAGFEFKKLAARCEVPEEEIPRMIDVLKHLNPRPASLYENFITQPLIPDIEMKPLPKEVGGGWRVELNSDTLPRVLVNNQYYKEISSKAKGKKDKEYLNNRLTAANWLVRAMDQRAKTILKVAGEIIEQQEAFFLYGVEFLQPLTLKDVAERIEMHESTVSRVTTNKYIATPRGIFELKYFFTTAIAGSNGIVYSAESIRARIKKLIDEESPDQILADDKIAGILKEEGVDIARRTVAKYREALDIPSSSLRKKRKRNQS